MKTFIIVFLALVTFHGSYYFFSRYTKKMVRYETMKTNDKVYISETSSFVTFTLDFDETKESLRPLGVDIELYEKATTETPFLQSTYIKYQGKYIHERDFEEKKHWGNTMLSLAIVLLVGSLFRSVTKF